VGSQARKEKWGPTSTGEKTPSSMTCIGRKLEE
jgi:hypothetical protein